MDNSRHQLLPIQNSASVQMPAVNMHNSRSLHHQNVLECNCRMTCWTNVQNYSHRYTHTHTHTRLTALFPGLPGWAGTRKVKPICILLKQPGWAGTRKVKPIWILLKEETVSGSGISWAICKSASRSRQITTLVLHHSKFFTGRMPFLPPNQQRQSTDGTGNIP